MRVKAYALRHQKAGVLADTVYHTPPSEEQQAAVKARLDKVHSTDGWLRVVTTTLVLPDTFADIADRFELADEEPAPQGREAGVSGVADVAGPRVSIAVQVVNP